MMKKHLLSTRDLELSEIERLLKRAEFFSENRNSPAIKELGKNCFVTNFFLEPSTRTRFSFEIAQKRLGCNVINFQSNDSSIKKGETLYDTLKTLEVQGVEIAVVRLCEEGILSQYADKLSLTLINAGEGTIEHPTQALLDLYTIKQHFGEVKGLTMAIIGDIRHSRVAHSNYQLLTRLGVKLIFSGPEEFMDSRLAGEYLPIDEAIKAADVVMMLRIQFERQELSYLASKEDYNRHYGLTEERARLLNPQAIILHPAPINRGVEIAGSVVEHPQSKIFKQMENGVWIRMAIIERAFKEV